MLNSAFEEKVTFGYMVKPPRSSNVTIIMPNMNINFCDLFCILLVFIGDSEWCGTRYRVSIMPLTHDMILALIFHSQTVN